MLEVSSPVISQSVYISVKNCNARGSNGTWITFTHANTCPNGTQSRGVTLNGESIAWTYFLKKVPMVVLGHLLAIKGSIILTGKIWTNNHLYWKKKQPYFNNLLNKKTGHMKISALDQVIKYQNVSKSEKNFNKKNKFLANLINFSSWFNCAARRLCLGWW